MIEISPMTDQVAAAVHSIFPVRVSIVLRMGFFVAAEGFPVIDTDTHKPKLINPMTTMNMDSRAIPMIVLGSAPMFPALRALSRPILFILSSPTIIYSYRMVVSPLASL